MPHMDPVFFGQGCKTSLGVGFSAVQKRPLPWQGSGGIRGCVTPSAIVCFGVRGASRGLMEKKKLKALCPFPPVFRVSALQANRVRFSSGCFWLLGSWFDFVRDAEKSGASEFHPDFPDFRLETPKGDEIRIMGMKPPYIKLQLLFVERFGGWWLVWVFAVMVWLAWWFGVGPAMSLSLRSRSGRAATREIDRSLVRSPLGSKAHSDPAGYPQKEPWIIWNLQCVFLRRHQIEAKGWWTCATKNLLVLRRE